MSSAFPPSLRPAARSAFRAVVRSSRRTFKGDPARYETLLSVVRQTFRSPTLTPPPTRPGAPAAALPSSPATSSASTTSTAGRSGSSSADSGSSPSSSSSAMGDTVPDVELLKRIDEWREVALFLRRNIVQGVRDDQAGAYRLRVTPDTELGDNTTIREPPRLPTTPFPNRNRRRGGEAQATAT